MRVCIFTEGSYPHVLGGVSSWINTYIKSCPEHEFIIYAIGSDSSKKGKYKYEIPNNVEVKEIFLDSIDIKDCKSGKKYSLEDKHKENIKTLLKGKYVNWDGIFEFIKANKYNDVGEFFLSKDFFGIVTEVYNEGYFNTPFTEFLWNIRSMYITLFYLLMLEMPKADIYHSICTGYSGVLASFSKYLHKSSFVLSEHGIYTREREEEIIKSSWIKPYHKEMWINFFKSLSMCSYTYSDIVTSLFENNKKIQVSLGCKEDKIRIIPNGIDVEKYKNLASKEDESVINIGAIVRVVPIKDIKTMLLSFRLVKEKVKNAKFYIMGPTEEDKEYYDNCLKLIKELNIQDVILTGTINVLDYICKMDILVLTSISEGQPLSVMEGMAAKRPHVCTNVGHCRGLLEGDGDEFGRNGFIESVTDYKAIASSIVRLAKDEKLRKDFGVNGYNRVSKLYRREDMINNYKKVYNECGRKR
ncbi:MAG: DUF3492 domain-containing protein [Clostridium sp.]|nr:DUF3492 domain-containing protein [Clostridium sp.]